MNVSLNWLSQQLDLAGLALPAISDMLTFAGVEVEGIVQKGVATDLVVVAQVKEAVVHPNADRLKVCQVDVGDGTLRQIVCGAQNYKVGDKVPCALPGATLPGDFTIKVGKLRDVESQGMLCSASELGYADKVDGLWILNPDLPLGTPIRALFPSDTLIEVEVTPNRPDLLSHSGMARELSALTGRACQPNPETLAATRAGSDIATAPAGDSISLNSPSACPFYTATRVSGVKVGPSPEWLADRLTSIGLRPINNIVDITNYVLHQTGHPLHAFDAARVNGNIVVRQATAGETFLALDDQTYTLQESDLVISDQSATALALAGVMGGKDSGVSSTTTDIILESAWFQPSGVRATSRRLVLSSDSSYRFERGAAPSNAIAAARLAVGLILEIAGGQVSSPILVAGEPPVLTGQVALPNAKLAQVTANSVAPAEASEILSRLGLDQAASSPEQSLWNIPDYRADLQRPIDLIEEVTRVVGLDRIPSRYQASFVPASPVDKAYDFQMALRRQLVALGIHEIQTIKLIAPESLDAQTAALTHALPLKPLRDGDVIRVALPLSEDHSVLRPSLLPGLVATAVRNANQGLASLRFFEIGRVFRNAGGGKAKDIESDSLGLLIAGEIQPASWSNRQAPLAAAQDLLAIVQAMLPSRTVRLVPNKTEGFAQSADIMVDGKPLGAFARLALATCRELGLPEATFAAEIDIRKLQEFATRQLKAQPLPQFPGSSRDAAFLLPVETPNAAIEKALASLKQPLLVGASCFDVFADPTGQKLAPDAKSLAWRFEYRANDRTLTGPEVDAAHTALLQHLAKQVKGLQQR